MTASKINLGDSAMRRAARGGRMDIVKLCKKRGVTDFDGAMWRAAYRGHFDIAELCEEWGATDFHEVMYEALVMVDIEIEI